MSSIYPVGTLGHDLQGRHLRILDSYIEARAAARVKAEAGVLSAEEAMSTSDFPTYLGSFQRHSFLGRFTEVSGAWGQYTRPMSVEDFEEHTTSRFGRFPDIPRKSLNAEYPQMALRELPGPSIRLQESGAAWAVTRQLVLSDRLSKLSDLPTLAGEAMARTISKAAVAALLANALAYDGIALINASHNNIGSTALTADIAGANAIKAGIDAIRAQTDPEGYKVVNPTDSYILLVPTALTWIANTLATETALPIDVTSSTSLQRTNEVRGRFTVVEEPYLTDATNWYLIVEPSGENGFMAAVTLNGNNTPFIGQQDAGVRALLGGDEPYSFAFDEINYKIRHDWDFKVMEWRGIFGSIVAG